MGEHAFALHMAANGRNVQFDELIARLRGIVPAALLEAWRSPKTAARLWATCISDNSSRRTCFAGNDLLQAPGRTVPAPTTCGRGGIGRRAALRSLWGNPWKFESSRPHQSSLELSGRQSAAMMPSFYHRSGFSLYLGNLLGCEESSAMDEFEQTGGTDVETI